MSFWGPLSLGNCTIQAVGEHLESPNLRIALKEQPGNHEKKLLQDVSHAMSQTHAATVNAILDLSCSTVYGPGNQQHQSLELGGLGLGFAEMRLE